MTLDQSKVGQGGAEQMEAIENDYGDDCEIGDVCTIVEVVGPHGSHVRVRSSDMRPHSGLGLIRMAEQAMLGNRGGASKYRRRSRFPPHPGAAGTVRGREGGSRPVP